MAATIHVDVVSAEESIFSGEARFVALPGEAGELGIYPRHTPLITRIRPGAVRIETADGGEEFVFVAGGILEVQPNTVTVLSDTAIRGKDLDDEKASASQGRRRGSAEERQERHRHRHGAVRAGGDGRADCGLAKVPAEEVGSTPAAVQSRLRAACFLARSPSPRAVDLIAACAGGPNPATTFRLKSASRVRPSALRRPWSTSRCLPYKLASGYVEFAGTAAQLKTSVGEECPA